jgi:hypothetical protein
MYTYGDLFRAIDKRFPNSPVPSSFSEEERKELENVPLDQSSSAIELIKSQTPITPDESMKTCTFRMRQ